LKIVISTFPWLNEISLQNAFHSVILLSNVTLQSNFSDHWQWHSDIVGGYSVRISYQLLTSQESPLLDASENLIWHTQMPLKVFILAWRFLRDRLPTKLNLLNRGIISAEDISCSAGYGQVVSAHHMFLHCDTFGSLWQQVRSLIDVSGLDSSKSPCSLFPVY